MQHQGSFICHTWSYNALTGNWSLRIPPNHLVLSQPTARALGWDGVETGALAVQYGGESRGGALLKAPVSYPPGALTCLRARPKMAGKRRFSFL